MAHLSLALLGPFQATLDGVPITTFESARVRALLAYLAVEVERPRPREVLIGLLWPDWPQRSALTSLRTALSSLRQSVGDRQAQPPFLLITREMIQFNRASDYTLDVESFTSDLTGLGDLSGLEQAIALYRGPFLEGFSLSDSPAFEEWITLQREHLGQRMLGALQRLAAWHEKHGGYEQAEHYARRQLELEPTREEAQRQLMRALALRGERSAALAQYESCRRVLGRELGVEPAGETTALYERIRAGMLASDGTLLAVPPPEVPHPTPRAARAHNLPAQALPFVGREVLLDEIVACLRDPTCRLLSLIGPGGSGKTRLALEAAARLLPEEADAPFRDGVFLVALAPLQAVESIVPGIAQAIGFPFAPAGSGDTRPAKAQLLDGLREKRMLLVLDNYEHLLEGAGLTAELLEAAPGVKLMVTSRARLNLQAEQLLPIPGMDVPAPGADHAEKGDIAAYSAVKLFLQGARRVRRGYALTPEELHDIAEVCRRVQGMPLALLLAAAWMRMLSPREIAAEIAHSLDFLESDARDLPERQRSLRATFEHTWRLLSAREQEVYAALCVFRGGFTWPAAQEVAGATLRELRALVDKSLLESVPGGRYAAHDLLRQYAQEKLAQSPDGGAAVHERHAAHYVVALERWGAEMEGAGQLQALAEMDAEIGNARAAWDWMVKQRHVEQIECALGGLCDYYYQRTRFEESAAACDLAIAALGGGGLQPACVPADSLRALVAALTWRAGSRLNLPGGAEHVRNTLGKTLALVAQAEAAGLEVRREKAGVLRAMGALVGGVGSLAEARELYAQSLALYREIDDRPRMAAVLNLLGWVAYAAGCGSAARPLLEESLAICRSLGQPTGTALVLWHLSHIAAADEGQLESAEALAREALALFETIGGHQVALGVFTLSNVLVYAGRFAEARALCARAVESLGRWGHFNLAFVYWILGSAEAHLGHYDAARAAFERGVEILQAHGLSRDVGFTWIFLGLVALAQKQYAEAAALCEEGLAIRRQSGVTEDPPWRPTIACGAELGLGHLERAREHLREALRLAAQGASVVGDSCALGAMALLLAYEGQAERAVELYALVLRYAAVANSRWWHDVVGQYVEVAAAALPAEVVAAAQERGRQRDRKATIMELLTEMEGQPASDKTAA